MTETTMATPIEKAPDLTKNTVLLNLSLSRPGRKRKANVSQIETDADRSMLHLTKDLYESDELEAIEKEDGALRTWLYRRALPSKVFRAGIYLVPVGLLEKVDQRITEHEQRREQLIEAFLSTYPERIADAQRRLGSQYDARDYPPPQRIREAFAVDWSYFTMGTPDQLAGLSRSLWEREKEKAERQWTAATDEVRQLLRASMADLVEHMADRLQPGENGKRKVFRDSLVGNLREFLETFPARNVTGDEDLQALVSRARDLLSGVDPDVLRKSEDIRDSVQRGMEQIKSQLDTMVTERPRRRIKFD